MEEIGLFPLGLVLLPTEQVPLHIFEPRYRELIGETLEHGLPFGIVYADDDGLRQIGTLAAVTEVVERFSDGRLNIVVEGGPVPAPRAHRRTLVRDRAGGGGRRPARSG